MPAAAMTSRLSSARTSIAQLGAVFNPPTFDATHAVYVEEHAELLTSSCPIEIVPDVAYGEHERQQMDVSLRLSGCGSSSADHVTP